MGNYGIKITKPGYDVSSASLSNQEFNSSYNIMKTSHRGTFSSTASGQRSFDIYNLPYRCGFITWFEVDNNGRWYPGGTYEDYSGANCIAISYIDDADVLRTIFYSSSSKLITVRFFLLADPGDY